MSFVDVSPSTVSELYELSVALTSIGFSSFAGMAASVITKPSVVAIFGWIMPEPFVMPATTTVPPRNLTSSLATFICVSVVIIARAALSNEAASGDKF